jgi:predicted enzyme related to lactoylglutathione lyase
MLAKGFAMATVPAEDLERAIKFYTEKLGLKHEKAGEEGAAVFEAAGGSKIFMYQRGRTKAEHTAITFDVPDLEAAVKEITAKGVKFEQYDFGQIKTNEMGIAATGGSKAAWLTDTEGNILALVQNS